MTNTRHDVFTVTELAEYLKVPKSTIYKLAQEGQLVGQKVGRHWRFHRDAVDRWLTDAGASAQSTKKGPAPHGSNPR